MLTPTQKAVIARLAAARLAQLVKERKGKGSDIHVFLVGIDRFSSCPIRAFYVAPIPMLCCRSVFWCLTCGVSRHGAQCLAPSTSTPF